MEKTANYHAMKQNCCGGNRDSVEKYNHVRRIVYTKAHGRCQLCGGDISLDEMVLERVSSPPIDGKEKVENLQCICKCCSQIKGNMSTKNLIDKITEIFICQAEKRFGDECSWKIARNIIMSIL